MPEPVDISQFPTQLAEALNISLFGAQLLASSITMLIFLLPIILIARKKDAALITTLTGFSVLGFLVAVGWLPVWNFVIILLLIGLMFSNKIIGGLRG